MTDFDFSTLVTDRTRADVETLAAALLAIYSIKHTQDPKRAKPYMTPNGTSGMYMAGDCAVDAGHVRRSGIDNNVWRPTEYPAGWEDWEVQA